MLKTEMVLSCNEIWFYFSPLTYYPFKIIYSNGRFNI